MVTLECQLAKRQHPDLLPGAQAFIIGEERLAAVNERGRHVQGVHGAQAEVGPEMNGAHDHSAIDGYQRDARRSLYDLEIVGNQLAAAFPDGAG